MLVFDPQLLNEEHTNDYLGISGSVAWNNRTGIELHMKRTSEPGVFS